MAYGLKELKLMPALQQVFQPRDIGPNLFAGFISGLMTLIASISYATLIFSGTLSGMLNLGIASALVSAVIIGFVVSCRSSSPFVIAGPDANFSAIVALMAASIAAHMNEAHDPAAFYSTLWAALCLSTASTGIFLYILGRFNMGRWIRFIPYPVIGGFLAGTGWLLISGSFSVMVGLPLSPARLLQYDQFIHWLPGVVLALLLSAVLRFYRHFLIMPVILLGSIVLVHLALYAAGIPVAEASSGGWLLEPLPDHLLFDSLKSLSFENIQWAAIASESAGLIVLMTVAAIVILLNAASIEIVSRTDIDLDIELKTNGAANVVAAPLGGLVGCIALSRSLLNFKAGATSRISGMAAALFCACVLLLGTSSIGYFPRPILGGLLLYLGLSLLIEWVYDGWFRLSRFDYLLVVSIIVIIAVFGFLPGVGVGFVAACILFAFNYSRINVVKHELSGNSCHSNVQRSYREQKLLSEQGREIAILRLQGYIFFGTAYNLLVHVYGLLHTAGRRPARYLILDFTFVSGLDSSSVMVFSKMRQFAEANSLCLIFVHVNPATYKMLQEGGCFELMLPSETSPQAAHCRRLFSDIDYAIEWCENEILSAGRQQGEPRHLCLQEHLAELFPEKSKIKDLMQYLERLEVPADQVLFKQGMPAEDLYFVEQGSVTAFIEFSKGSKKRLRTMGPGTVVGEMALYLDTPRSATVCTDQPSVLYRLKAGALQTMEQANPELAANFHRFIVRMLASRLIHTNEELSMLSR